jgi:hypothetical protein
MVTQQPQQQQGNDDAEILSEIDISISEARTAEVLPDDERMKEL